MKIELSEHSSRFLNVTGIPRGHPADVDKLAVYVMYRDTASVENALALDGQVIPQIVRAVNLHDELVAALDGCVRWLEALREANEISVIETAPEGVSILAARAAIAKAKGTK